MTNLLRVILCGLFLMIGSAAAFSQSITLWGEAGSQQTRIGNGETNRTDFGYGGGVNAIFGGKSAKKWAFLIPLGFEFRSDKKFEFKDFVLYSDAAFRVRNLSFGPGVNFSYLSRGDVRDSNCTEAKVLDFFIRNGATASSSCLASDQPGTLVRSLPDGRTVRLTKGLNGFREIGEFFGFGVSGYGRYAFGPQGRAFVQGRYIYYNPNWIKSLSKEALANQLNIQGGGFAEPTDFPEFSKGRDVRISAGYVFGGEKIAKILRVQYVDRQFDFRREAANISGVFNQKTRQFTGGFGIVF